VSGTYSGANAAGDPTAPGVARVETPSGYRAAKRTLDVVVAGAALIALAPVLALIAALVKATSRGPVLYRWQVVGEGGEPFTGYKFRTMVADADARKAELTARNEMIGPVFKIRDDPRITRVGRVLRRYSLDELPQLWSVLVGHMSLVGPRPPLRTEYARFTTHQRQKLAVRPGLTCLWQVSGRHEVADFDEWIRLDLEYIERRSFWLDLRILWRTVGVVGRGV
jgi:lipopolysaccharide/colanic/teichoic acid biosynthesis glycosyltransferase